LHQSIILYLYLTEQVVKVHIAGTVFSKAETMDVAQLSEVVRLNNQ
jgi:hypothetical protein